MKKFLLLLVIFSSFYGIVCAQQPQIQIKPRAKAISNQRPKGVLYAEKGPTIINNMVCLVEPQRPGIDSAVCFEQQWVRSIGDRVFVLRFSEYPSEPWRNNLRVMDRTVPKRNQSIGDGQPMAYFVDQFHRVGSNPTNPKIMFIDSQKRLQFSYESNGKPYTIELEFGAGEF